jgi:hypothetical protein
MDYGKISAILTQLHDNKDEFLGMEYVSNEYFTYLNDALVLATMVNADWVEPTALGEVQLDIAWKTLCDLRDLDYTVMYDTPMDFFMAQAVE